MRTENERKSLQEILNRAETGSAFDPAGIRMITGNFVACRGTELLTELDPEDMTKEEWYENLCTSAGLAVRESSYYYLIHLLSLMAEDRGVDEETLIFLSSLFFLGGKKVKPYMEIAVTDLMKAAGLDDIYDVWFRADAELFAELKGRPATVRDVLKNCFEMFDLFPWSHENRPYAIIRDLNPGATDGVTRPFFRKKVRGRNDVMIAVCTVAWIWTLLVLAPLKIIRK